MKLFSICASCSSFRILWILWCWQITVDADRTVVAFYKFLKKHASIPFKLQKPTLTPKSEESDAKESKEGSTNDVKDELWWIKLLYAKMSSMCYHHQCGRKRDSLSDRRNIERPDHREERESQTAVSGKHRGKRD